MKNTIFKKRTLALITLFSIALLGVSHVNLSVFAVEIEGPGATITLDNSDPRAMSAIVPTADHYAYAKYDGANQAEFVLCDWRGDGLEGEEMDYLGEDVSDYYPLIENDLLIDSMSYNSYIDPWNDVYWLETSAYYSEDPDLSPFTVHAAYNRFTMSENAPLAIEVDECLPTQVDIAIGSTGPKVLKLDFLNLEDNVYFNELALVSPSGNVLFDYDEIDLEWAEFYDNNGDYLDYIEYLPFVAHETGTYRLLMEYYVEGDISGFLYLEFLDSVPVHLTRDTLSIVGNVDDSPSVQDILDLEWGMDWYGISGSKGDCVTLELGWDLIYDDPRVEVWVPLGNGEYVSSEITYWDDETPLYFLGTGDIYVSITTQSNMDPYRGSLLAKSVPVISSVIGDDEDLRVNLAGDEFKAVGFTLARDSFVRLNFTSGGQGDAWYLDAYYGPQFTTFYGIVNLDAKFYPGIAPIAEEDSDMKEMTYFYYYFPAGQYRMMLHNYDPIYPGWFDISSKFVEEASSAIPMNEMSYPSTLAAQSATINFENDVYEPHLMQGKWTTIEVPELGFFRLNTTIYASDNNLPTIASPARVITYTESTGEYLDVTSEAQSLDATVFQALYNQSDRLYIAYPEKWHGMEFDLAVGASAVGDIYNYVYLWNGEGWGSNSISDDSTSEFMTDGSVVLNIEDGDYYNWNRGVGETFDLSGVNEDEYYWSYFEVQANHTTAPIIDFIQLSNITMNADIDFVMFKESEYDRCIFSGGEIWYDFDQPSDVSLMCSQSPGYEYDTDDDWFLYGEDLALEAGTYKILMIPDSSMQETILVQFAALNYWDYNYQETYSIISEPIIHSDNLTAGMTDATHPYNYTTYPYDINTELNASLYQNPFFDAPFYIVECTGTEYAWTQLITSVKNATIEAIFLLQDLNWQEEWGPDEFSYIDLEIDESDCVYEFGVFSEKFYLVYIYTPDNSINNTVQFNIGLSQYDTQIITTQDTSISTSSGEGIPVDDLTLIGVGVVGGGAAAVLIAGVVIKKKR